MPLEPRRRPGGSRRLTETVGGVADLRGDTADVNRQAAL